MCGTWGHTLASPGAFSGAVVQDLGACLGLTLKPLWGDVRDSGAYLGLRLGPFHGCSTGLEGMPLVHRDMGACHGRTPGRSSQHEGMLLPSPRGLPRNMGACYIA